MKNTIIAAVAVLMVIGLVSCSYAAGVDVVGGQKVNITVKAEVPALLKVHLSDTTIDFGTIKSTATQQKKIDITITSTLGKNPTMTVTGALALTNTKDHSKTINTAYAVRANYGVTPQPGQNVVIGNWETPTHFNRVHELTTIGYNELWSRIIPNDLKSTGTYSNCFTVVFSQKA